MGNGNEKIVSLEELLSKIEKSKGDRDSVETYETPTAPTSFWKKVFLGIGAVGVGALCYSLGRRSGERSSNAYYNDPSNVGRKLRSFR